MSAFREQEGKLTIQLQEEMQLSEDLRRQRDELASSRVKLLSDLSTCRNDLHEKNESLKELQTERERLALENEELGMSTGCVDSDPMDPEQIR